jgi:hypothetical protein
MAAKTRISLRLEFYLRGKSRIPSVSFIEGTEGHGIPLSSHAATEAENKAFSVLSEAAHSFCAQMKASGELK